MLVLAAGLVAFPAEAADAQDAAALKPGRTALVARDGAPLMSSGKTIATLSKGTAVTVGNVAPTWVGVWLVMNGSRVSGWMNPADLEPDGAAELVPIESRRLYDRLLRSTVCIRCGWSIGTGTLIDRSKRLVLTCEHVVRESREAHVLLPVYSDGKLVSERQAYANAFQAGESIRATVYARDRKRDLALLQLDGLAPDRPVESIRRSSICLQKA